MIKTKIESDIVYSAVPFKKKLKKRDPSKYRYKICTYDENGDEDFKREYEGVELEVVRIIEENAAYRGFY
jgi:hypothetical protein